MRLLAIALGLSVVGTFGGLVLASTLLLLHGDLRTRLVPSLISYAVGTLLGVSLLDLLPEALAQLSARAALGALLAGILAFFALEKLLLWQHHSHTDHCEVHHGTGAPLVLVGDALHNGVDGALIAAAVMSSVTLGITAAIAVAAHEIPHKVGDFAILLNAGYTRARALSLNLLSAAAGLAGALGAFVAIERVPAVIPYLLTVASASFLYIAMADLIPDLHRGQPEAGAIRQVLLVSAGVATILAL